MPKRKVLFVVHHLTIGGVQKSLISALNALDYDSNDVTLYVRRNRLVLLPYINKRVNVIVNDDKHHYYRSPKALWFQFLLKLNEIIKIDNSKIKNNLNEYIHIKQMKYERKRFFSIQEYEVAIAYNEGHTAEFVMENISSKKKCMFFQSSVDSLHNVHKKIMPVYDSIIVEHQDIKELLLEWYPEIYAKRIIVHGNYTDPKLLRKMSKEMANPFPEKDIKICTCSRFSYEKGIDLAIEVANVLKQKGCSFHWYIVGDGPEMESVNNLISKYSLQSFISLPGMQRNPYPYMASCDIYVQPSREEALSISMLESQMLSAPMVSTKTAGGLAMIQEGVNGLLADINAESLANSIETLIENEELRLNIKKYLDSIDYSKEEIRYKNNWKKLLE